ncbi:hybrid sensor histidine kinase/response regulator [Salegentibacter chungangensis]|uniref:histidine kinase n=1 Tax=Salegentibacter chungangensis TaxID=1335724 RepID=A0ABW3NNR0_9FLAO
MLNTRRSITLKVLAGYILVAALAAIAVWVVYNRVVAFTDLAQKNNTNNEKLFLVSEITTGLYKTENISRRLIQTGDSTEVERYRNQIDSIKGSIRKLQQTYPEGTMQTELDSILVLLSRKTSNLEELNELRQEDRSTNYYTRVINELKKVDESFADKNYEQRFSNLEPHQRKVLIRLLEYAEEDNAKKLTNKTADSLINQVKSVLNELEIANERFRNTLFKKETELLDNDTVLNQQLRKILSKIEQEEREASLAQAENSQEMLTETSRILFIAGAISIAIILGFLVLIVRDVTRSHQYRVELEEAKTFAESLLKSREQFMAAITHDLRSPLTTVIGYTDLLEKTGLNTKQQHYLRQLRKSSDFILHLVNDLLDLSKLEAGKMLIENLPFNPKKLVEDTVTNSLPGELKENVKVVTDIDENCNLQVLSDPFRIKQVIANLVTNAYKFTEKGEVKVSARLENKASEDETLIISVKDTGIGIPEDKQEAIFEEFSQENSKIEKTYGGTGLGLSITKRITELLKGKIELKSEQGKGSEFIVSLPVEKPAKNEEKPKATSKEETGLNLKGKKALAVDDEPSQLVLTKELVKSLGMECDSCLDGEEALKKIKAENYDLVLTDIQMPKVDGFQLIKFIRANEKIANLPVIALSGRTDVNAEAYLKAGFTGSLLKPYKPADLHSKIAEIFKLEVIKKERTQTLQKQKNSNYNLEEIYEFSGGDEQAMQVILKAFLQSAETNIRELREALKNDDKEEMGRIAHKMLPMLKQMQAGHIIPELQKLEAHEPVPEPKVKKLILQIEELMKSLEAEITV